VDSLYNADLASNKPIHDSENTSYTTAQSFGHYKNVQELQKS